MVDTPSSRGFAWGLQSDYATQKSIATSALRAIIASDENTIDYNPMTNTDEGWATLANQATEQWLEAHDAKVQHSMAAYIDEIGRVLILNLGQYSVGTYPLGTTAKKHVFKPLNPQVSRQNKAVTYAETTGPGWNVLMPRSVSDGFSLKGDGHGVLSLDFGLQGAGLIDPASTVTWPPTSTPTVVVPTNREKFFNTQVGIVATPDGDDPVEYACRYRSFSLDFKQTLLLDAGFKPGCGEFNTDGDFTSGIIRSACEFDKQTCNFTFEVDMASGSPELALVQSQTPIELVITAQGSQIELDSNDDPIYKSLTITVPIAYYKTTKPSVKNGIYTFTISGEAFYDYNTSKMLEIDLVNTVSTYASGW